MLEYNDENAHVTIKREYPHRREIWDMVTVPHDPTLLFTTYLTEENKYKTSLWRMSGLDDCEKKSAKVILPEELIDDKEVTNKSISATSDEPSFISPDKPENVDGSSDGLNDNQPKEESSPNNNRQVNSNSNEITDGELDHITDINVEERVKQIIIKPYLDDSDPLEILTVHDHCIKLWIFKDNNKLELENNYDVDYEVVSCGDWDLFHIREYAIAVNHDIHFIDTRYNKYVHILIFILYRRSHLIKNVHDDIITGIQYNPNKPWILLTYSKDRYIKILNCQKKGEILRVLSGHSHWITHACFNPFHDQLLLSCGTDMLINLWRIPSISSISVKSAENHSYAKYILLLLIYSQGEANDEDEIINTYEPHEDSIYNVRWSQQDPWVFSSLSYDGTIIFNRVPNQEIYKILL